MNRSSRTKVIAAAATVLGAAGAGLTATAAMAAGSGGSGAQPDAVISSGGPGVATASPPALVLEAAGLAVGTTDQGYLYGEGPAPAVAAVSMTLHDLGINEIAGYTGANETGTGAVMVITSGSVGTAGPICVDAPPTLPAIDDIDNLTPSSGQVYNGSCADSGQADGLAVGAGKNANLPAEADWHMREAAIW
jgi:hypothetical protein